MSEAVQPKMTTIQPRLVNAYIDLVILSGVMIGLAVILNLPENHFGLIVFAILAAVTQLADVELFPNSRSRISVSVIIAIASILLFGPLAGACTHMVSGLVSALTTSRSKHARKGRASWYLRGAFNTGMLACASASAGGVYMLLGGSFEHVEQWTNVLPLFAAAATDVIVNLAILIGVISLQTHRPALKVLRENYEWSVPILIVGGAIGGLALAFAYQSMQLLGVAVFMLPIIATSYSIRLYVRNSSGYMARLEEMNNRLENANNRLERANNELLSALGAVIDAYDVYTFGHSNQITVYAVALAEKLGLPPAEQARIKKAAQVHDIGKVGILDSIIGKRSRLSDDEYAYVKRHPIIGAEILQQMEELKCIVPDVRHHHERWDGLGYPDGLRGEQIPIGARIICLADAIDAMLSDRPYRRTLSFTEALGEIERYSGTQFDPKIVAAFFEIVSEQGRDFFKNSAQEIDSAMLLSGVAMSQVDNRYMKKSMLDLQTRRLFNPANQR